MTLILLIWPIILPDYTITLNHSALIIITAYLITGSFNFYNLSNLIPDICLITILSQVWCYMAVIPALKKIRKEDCCKYQICLGYRVKIPSQNTTQNIYYKIYIDIYTAMYIREYYLVTIK